MLYWLARPPVPPADAPDSGAGRGSTAHGQGARARAAGARLDIADAGIPISRWRQLKALFRDASHVVRDRILAALASASEEVDAEETRLAAVARARALSTMNVGALWVLPGHWQGFDEVLVSESSGRPRSSSSG